MRRITSRSPISDKMNISWSAVEKVHTKNRRFSPFFYSNSMDIHRIVNRGVGGASPHGFAFFSNTSVLGVTDIQRPIAPKIFIGCPKCTILCTLHHPGAIRIWSHTHTPTGLFGYSRRAIQALISYTQLKPRTRKRRNKVSGKSEETPCKLPL